MTVSKEIKNIKAKKDDVGVLTIYLNTDVGAETQSSTKWRIHLKNGLNDFKNRVKNIEDKEDTKAMKNLLADVESRIDDLQIQMQRSLILIASADGELWEEKILQVPVTTAFHWENTANTGQLEELEQKYPEEAIIVVQQTDIKFMDVALGKIRSEINYSWDVNSEDWVDYHDVSPPSATDTAKDQFDKRFEENKHRWYKNLVPRLSKEIKNRNLTGAYLVGSKESVSELEASMSDSHLKGVINKNLGSKPSHEILTEVYEAQV